VPLTISDQLMVFQACGHGGCVTREHTSPEISLDEAIVWIAAVTDGVVDVGVVAAAVR
jgi:hypothetical protein